MAGAATARKERASKVRVPDAVDRLAALVGEDRVTVDDMERELYAAEIANLPPEVVYVFNVKPDIVVRPSTTEEVVGIVNIARDHRLPVTPRGAGTLGLGGSLPSRGGILLDMSTMDRILEVDPEGMYAVVEAGVTWEELRKAARAKGMRVGAYPSSAMAATVGGWIGGGGVGIGSYRYGPAADQVSWLEVVLPSGRVIETGFRGVMDNASGYALTNLFVGSEGTLGVVTRAAVRLRPREGDVLPTAYAFKDLATASRGILALTRAPVTPYNVSFVDGNHLSHLRELGSPVPEAAGAVVTVALEGSPGEVELCDAGAEAAMGPAGGRRLSGEEGSEAWLSRSYEFRVKRLGPGLVPGSVFVPAHRFPEAVERVYNAISDLGMKAGITGLVADRTTVDVLPYYIVDDRRMMKGLAVMSFMKRLTDIALSLGGRPVGVGMWFAQNLGRLHGEGANVMRDIKRALDPDGLMNPGKLVEVGTRYDLAVPATVMNAGLELMGVLKRTLPADTEPGEVAGPGGQGWRDVRAPDEDLPPVEVMERTLEMGRPEASVKEKGRRKGGGKGKDGGKGRSGGKGGAKGTRKGKARGG